MSTVEILESVRYVVDSQGRQTAVQLDLAVWETLRPLLAEIIEDRHLGELMIEVENDERLEENTARQAYQTYLAEAAS